MYTYRPTTVSAPHYGASPAIRNAMRLLGYIKPMRTREVYWWLAVAGLNTMECEHLWFYPGDGWRWCEICRAHEDVCARA